MNEKAKWNGTSKENYDEKAQIKKTEVEMV